MEGSEGACLAGSGFCQYSIFETACSLFSRKIEVGAAFPHQLAHGLPQLLRGWPPSHVPAVENAVNLQPRQQGEGQRNREGAVLLVGGFANSQLIGQLQGFIAEKGEVRPQPRLEGLLHPGGIGADHGDFTIGYLGGLMELDQFPQLKLSFRSPGPTIECKQEGGISGNPGDGNLASRFIGQYRIGKGIAGSVL